MLTKLMYPLLTIKLVKIKNKMRMPRTGEDTLKSVLLFNRPRGGVRVEGCGTFFKILWPWPSDMARWYFWWGCSALQWPCVCLPVCVLQFVCLCQHRHEQLYVDQLICKLDHYTWWMKLFKGIPRLYFLLCRYPLAVPLLKFLINFLPISIFLLLLKWDLPALNSPFILYWF